MKLTKSEIEEFQKIVENEFNPLNDNPHKTPLEEKRLQKLRQKLEPYRQHLAGYFKEKYGWNLD